MSRTIQTHRMVSLKLLKHRGGWSDASADIGENDVVDVDDQIAQSSSSGIGVPSCIAYVVPAQGPECQNVLCQRFHQASGFLVE